MKLAQWSSSLAGLRTQWQVNTRLRVGIWFIGGTLWVYALLLLGDHMAATRQASAQLSEEIDRLRGMARSNPWPTRTDDARQQLAALRSMLWNESTDGRNADVGLAEAALQDWLRSTAAKAGVRVRELSLARAGTASVSNNVVDAPSRGRTTPAPALAQAQLVRVRLSSESGRNELLGFLAEVGRYERVVVVERLLLRTGSQASPSVSAEMDLRIVADMAAGTPAAGKGPGGQR
jgi:hypothetical protein